MPTTLLMKFSIQEFYPGGLEMVLSLLCTLDSEWLGKFSSTLYGSLPGSCLPAYHANSIFSFTIHGYKRKMTYMHIYWSTAILYYIYISKCLIFKTKDLGPLNSIQKKPRVRKLLRNLEQIWVWITMWLYVFMPDALLFETLIQI